MATTIHLSDTKWIYKCYKSKFPPWWVHRQSTMPAVWLKKTFSVKERIFLINRTEHPRLVDGVRCLCMGCDVTWGPPCQALVTQLPANRRWWAEGNWLTQNSNNKTTNTTHSRFNVVRREAYVHGRSKESVFIEKGEYTLKISLLSWQEKKKQLELW